MFSPHSEMEWSVMNWRSSWALSVFVTDNVIVGLWCVFLTILDDWLTQSDCFVQNLSTLKLIMRKYKFLREVLSWRVFSFGISSSGLKKINSVFSGFVSGVFLAVVINRINFFLELNVLKRHTRYNKKKVDECEWRITLIWVNGSAPELPLGAGGWGGVFCIWLANKESLLWATLLLGSTECEVSSLWHRFFWKVTF